MTTPLTYRFDTLQPAEKPTLYFIGVTTAGSSIRQVFPQWADALGLRNVQLVGIDLPLHADPEEYRRVTEFIKADPLSLGALVTTHKIDMFHAAKDLFDRIDPLAELMDEISCISKRDGELWVHAKDPISSGFALEAFIPESHWSEHPEAQAFILGAGGSAVAISWYLTRAERGAEVPAGIVVTNRSPKRLEMLQDIYAAAGAKTPLTTVLAPSPELNDAALSRVPAGSVVINATGLGKDAPGSPLTDAAVFPQGSIAWDLNYRGDLVFLDQARTQSADRNVTVVDGWDYFLHGWTQVIAEVFHITIPTSGPEFERLSAIAASTRS
ncbi:shikimate dehydrogenase family protein [Lysinibacter cavernae]|uniref:Shikimate 5-dehydrogenase n=1 Tax=Lysinibacter cavernae TaxID=1640652 RepID=A0A7X5R0Z6_9MICO|nr:shikimate dehydrogenase [Lysinibacter cavernae]NIH53593.1 shikimate 5-dehydrogenase [Lysinibacter cavernae]